MEIGLIKMAAQVAKGQEYLDTGEIKGPDRKDLMQQAIAEIESIRAEQENLFSEGTRVGLINHHSQLEQKRLRYQKKKKNKDFGLKRHRQKRIIGKRSRRNDRLWEKGVILKKAQERFDSLVKEAKEVN